MHVMVPVSYQRTASNILTMTTKVCICVSDQKSLVKSAL